MVKVLEQVAALTVVRLKQWVVMLPQVGVVPERGRVMAPVVEDRTAQVAAV